MSREPPSVRTSKGDPAAAASADGPGGATGAASPDADLVSRIARGDREAFAAFYDRHAPAAFGLVRRLMGQAREAEDVLQETFWQVWRRAVSYTPERGSARTWLLLIARSRAIDHLRRTRSRRKAEHDSFLEAPKKDEDGFDIVDPEEEEKEKDVVTEALKALPDDQRKAIELAFLAGLTHREIAERIEQPLGTVKTRIRLGMGKLRDELRRKGRIGGAEAGV